MTQPTDKGLEAEPIKRWPFMESPGEFAKRLQSAVMESATAIRPDEAVLAGVRMVLIEEPPTLSPDYLALVLASLPTGEEVNLISALRHWASKELERGYSDMLLKAASLLESQSQELARMRERTAHYEKLLTADRGWQEVAMHLLLKHGIDAVPEKLRGKIPEILEEWKEDQESDPPPHLVETKASDP